MPPISLNRINPACTFDNAAVAMTFRTKGLEASMLRNLPSYNCLAEVKLISDVRQQ